MKSTSSLATFCLVCAVLAAWSTAALAAPATSTPSNPANATALGYTNRTGLPPLPTGKVIQPNGLWDWPAYVSSGVQEFVGSCVYGSNCGGSCSSVIDYSKNTKKPSWMWKVSDNLDRSCFNHDVCLFDSRYYAQSNCGNGFISSKLRSSNVNCDYWLYLDSKKIVDGW